MSVTLKADFCKMFSLNFPSKFESYNLQHCQKNCRKSVFCVFLEQSLPLIIFGLLHCYEVALIKKFNKPSLQKIEIKIFKQKIFYKKLVQSQREKNSGILKIMSKLLTISKCLQLNCWQIQQLLAIVTLF